MEHSSKKLHFGTTYLLENPTVEDAVSLCVQEGLSFVELNSNFPQCLLGRLQPEGLKRLAEEQGIFYTLHLDDRFDPFDFNPHVSKAYLQTMMEGLVLAQAVGIPVINMHIPRGNIVTLPSGRHYIYQEYPEAFMQSVLAFRTACEQHAGEKVRIAIENTDGWEPYELAAIEALLESPVFGLTLDVGHDHATGNRDLKFFEKYPDRLCHMHLHDGWEQTNHQALGTGVIPLKQRLAMAQRTNATVVLETKTKEALHQSVQYLKENGYL